jgi:predicted amidohydrolase YtcJ
MTAMNKPLANLLFILLCGLGLAACQDQQKSTGEAKNYVLIQNAQILTMDSERPSADALLIENNKIVAVGSGEDIIQNPEFKDSETTIIDLNGATVLPGFIDSHVHVRELGMDKIKADLVGVKNVEDIVARVTEFYPDPKPGEWLIGQGWDEGYFASIGYPDRAPLDAAFPGNPIHLESLHGFGGFYNGAALKIAGIDADTPNPKVGDILKRDDGVPTGVMLTLAQDLVNQHIPPASPERVQQAIKAGLQEMAVAGVTSIHEAGMARQDVEAFTQLRAKNQLPIRVYGMLDGNDEALMQEWFAKGPLEDDTDFLDIRGIKVFYDGSLGSRTALMAEPYSDEPDAASPTERISPAAVRSLADRAIQHGFQMAVHAIGDEGNNRTLNIYEAAIEGKNSDHRWRIEHAQVVLPDFYKRMADLGALASMQSSHAVGDSAWAEDRVGAERIVHAYAWQRILGAGGTLMMNSDLPGEPWTPMETLYFAVTRKHLDGNESTGWYADQALSTQQALEAMTTANAYGAYQEKMLGSLEPGKWADFVILDSNPLDTPADQLKDIKVLQTWVAGKKVADNP